MAKFTNAPAVAPTIPQEKVEQILNDLIAKAGPENLSQIPETLEAILTVLKANMPAPVQMEVKRKKRAPNANGYRPLGWPAGVARKEFQIWKEMQQAQGRTENLSPQDFKAERDAGNANIETLAGGVPTDADQNATTRGSQEFDDEPVTNGGSSDIEQELFASVGANATPVNSDVTTTLNVELDKAPGKATAKTGGNTKTTGKGGKNLNVGKGVESVLPA